MPEIEGQQAIAWLLDHAIKTLKEDNGQTLLELIQKSLASHNEPIFKILMTTIVIQKQNCIEWLFHRFEGTQGLTSEQKRKKYLANIDTIFATSRASAWQFLSHQLLLGHCDIKILGLHYKLLAEMTSYEEAYDYAMVYKIFSYRACSCVEALCLIKVWTHNISDINIPFSKNTWKIVHGTEKPDLSQELEDSLLMYFLLSYRLGSKKEAATFVDTLKYIVAKIGVGKTTIASGSTMSTLIRHELFIRFTEFLWTKLNQKQRDALWKTQALKALPSPKIAPTIGDIRRPMTPPNFQTRMEWRNEQIEPLAVATKENQKTPLKVSPDFVRSQATVCCRMCKIIFTGSLWVKVGRKLEGQQCPVCETGVLSQELPPETEVPARLYRIEKTQTTSVPSRAQSIRQAPSKHPHSPSPLNSGNEKLRKVQLTLGTSNLGSFVPIAQDLTPYSAFSLPLAQSRWMTPWQCIQSSSAGPLNTQASGRDIFSRLFPMAMIATGNLWCINACLVDSLLQLINFQGNRNCECLRIKQYFLATNRIQAINDFLPAECSFDLLNFHFQQHSPQRSANEYTIIAYSLLGQTIDCEITGHGATLLHLWQNDTHDHFDPIFNMHTNWFHILQKQHPDQ